MGNNDSSNLVSAVFLLLTIALAIGGIWSTDWVTPTKFFSSAGLMFFLAWMGAT